MFFCYSVFFNNGWHEFHEFLILLRNILSVWPYISRYCAQQYCFRTFSLFRVFSQSPSHRANEQIIIAKNCEKHRLTRKLYCARNTPFCGFCDFCVTLSYYCAQQYLFRIIFAFSRIFGIPRKSVESELRFYIITASLIRISILNQIHFLQGR